MSPPTSTICMNPGPIEFEPSVLKEMKRKGISHMDPSVVKVFQECLQMLRHVFLSDVETSQPFILSGSGTLGWDIVAANLCQPGDRALVINTGVFGDHFGTCLESYGVSVTHLKAKTLGDVPSLFDLKAALRLSTTYQIVTITHVDTSTGVLVDVEALARTIRELQPQALIVLDGVCALGGEECRMKDWDLDVVLTGSQKCIGVPAGLCLAMFSSRALRSQRDSPSTYYCNLHHWLPVMKAYESGIATYFATPAVNHVYALHQACLNLLANEGMNQRFVEHTLMSDAIKRAMTVLGCSQIPVTRDIAANTMTCVRYPPGVSSGVFLKSVTKHGVSLAGGLHPKIKTEYFRIGHMGGSTRRLDHALKTVQAIERAFLECGYDKFTPGMAEKEIQLLGRSESYFKPSRGSWTSRFTTWFTQFDHQGQDVCPIPLSCRVYSILGISAALALGFATAAVLKHKKY